MSTDTSRPARAELQHSLSRVHAELAATPQVDRRSRELLREVLADIERLLGELPPDPGERERSRGGAGNSAGSAAVNAVDSAPRRLEEVALQFEARHPLLAASVRQFVDLLGRAGL